MKHKTILLFAALSFAGCGADAQSEPEAAATRVQPLAWWTGDRVELGGSYDVEARMLSPTPSLIQRIAVESLTVHRPGESSAIAFGSGEVALGVGDALELRDDRGEVRGTLIVEDRAFVDTLTEQEASTSFEIPLPYPVCI